MGTVSVMNVRLQISVQAYGVRVWEDSGVTRRFNKIDEETVMSWNCQRGRAIGDGSSSRHVSEDTNGVCEAGSFKEARVMSV